MVQCPHENRKQLTGVFAKVYVARHILPNTTSSYSIAHESDTASAVKHIIDVEDFQIIPAYSGS